MKGKLNTITDWEKHAHDAHYEVQRLAKNCSASTRQLERFFKVSFGVTPKKWVNQIRLARALAELQAGALVKEAANEAGYLHPGNFSRFFKRLHGVRPATLRTSPAC